MTEIKLSRRMQAVADMVSVDSERKMTDVKAIKGDAAAYTRNVADIGCDHAFVSIYLKAKGIAGKVIAMDVKDGPLDIARANIASYGLSDYIDVRSSDGFDALETGEADVAIIAGMGGLLMVKILTRGKRHTDAGIELILQPQSEIDKVRAYLRTIQYRIVDEDMLMEDGKYYTIIKASPGKDSYSNPSVTDKFGPVLLEKKNATLKMYIDEQKVKNQRLRKSLSHAMTPKSEKRIRELEDEDKLLDVALEYFEV